MLLSLCAARVVAVIMKVEKKTKKWENVNSRMAKKHGLFRSLLPSLCRAQKPHINTFLKFHSNTAAVPVAMFDLSAKARDTKLENDWWTSTSSHLLKGIDSRSLELYSVQQRSTAVQHVEWHILTFNNT